MLQGARAWRQAPISLFPFLPVLFTCTGFHSVLHNNNSCAFSCRASGDAIMEDLNTTASRVLCTFISREYQVQQKGDSMTECTAATSTLQSKLVESRSMRRESVSSTRTSHCTVGKSSTMHINYLQGITDINNCSILASVNCALVCGVTERRRHLD